MLIYDGDQKTTRMVMGQNLSTLANIKLVGKWMDIHAHMAIIGFDASPNHCFS